MARASKEFKVVAYHPKDGTLFRMYDSAASASKSRHKSSRSIEKAIRGERLTAFGYIWKRLPINNIPTSIEPLPKKVVNKDPIPIAEIDENGNVINRYPSIRNASKSLNIDAHSIKDCLDGKFKSSNGHMFRNLNNDN